MGWIHSSQNIGVCPSIMVPTNHPINGFTNRKTTTVFGVHHLWTNPRPKQLEVVLSHSGVSTANFGDESMEGLLTVVMSNYQPKISLMNHFLITVYSEPLNLL